MDLLASLQSKLTKQGLSVHLKPMTPPGEWSAPERDPFVITTIGPERLGLSSIGAPGSTALLALLNDAVKKGGSFSSSYMRGLSGAFIPVPGKKAGERAYFGGLLGEASIMKVAENGGRSDFISPGGRIPVPVQSLVN